jgi:hypothetical protein
VDSLAEFLARAGHREEAERLGIAERLEHAREELERVSSPEYLGSLVGTIGADPIHREPSEPGRDVPAKSVSVLEAAAG